eukprot:1108890-Pyramimonas_sp.AAC.1
MPIELEPSEASRPRGLDLIVDDIAEGGQLALDLAGRGLRLGALRPCHQVVACVGGSSGRGLGPQDDAPAAVSHLLRGGDARPGERGLRGALAHAQRPGPAYGGDRELRE